MSRKNLSRTVIEGGRYHHNQFHRRESSRTERATTRAWIDQYDPENDSAPPPRKKVHRQFYDKLAPAKRWLASNVGRSWNKVYQQLCATFDRNTIAGNHVVEHMLDWVQFDGAPHSRYFIVDARGILRLAPLYGRSYSRLRKELVAWALGRRIVRTNRGLWWAAVSGAERCYDRSCRVRHEVLVENGVYTPYHRLAYTPLTVLTRADLNRLARTPTELRWTVMAG